MMRNLVVCSLGLFLLGVLTTPAAAQGARLDFLGKSADKWLGDLNTSDARARRNAAFALGKMGRGAEMAVQPLIQALHNDKSAVVREAAAFALGEICRGGRGVTAKVFGALTKALVSDGDSLVRRSAAFALGNIGSASPEAEQGLQNALGDRSAAVRQNAAWALGHIGPTALPALRKALGDKDSVVCRDAAGAVSLLGKDGHAAVPELLTCCGPDRDPELRKMALSVLVKLVGPEDTIAIQPLTQALNDRDLETKRNAAMALSNIGGPDAAAAVPILLDALHGGDLELKRQAAAAIKNIGAEARTALPALRLALDDRDEELRMNAAVAIGGIGEAAEPLVKDLVRHLADPKESSKVRTEAAVALSRIGAVPDAVNAVGKLLEVLGNPATDAKVRERTMWALRVHKAELRNLKDVFPTFVKILSEPRLHETRMLRYDCAYMLGLFLEKDAPAQVLDVLEEFLKDNTILIYTGTTASTGGTGTEIRGAKTKIEEKGYGDGRVMAVAALERIGKRRVLSRPEIVQQLLFLANDAETLSDMRKKTKELLKKLGK
jgi:HEAT repeat protein